MWAPKDQQSGSENLLKAAEVGFLSLLFRDGGFWLKVRGSMQWCTGLDGPTGRKPRGCGGNGTDNMAARKGSRKATTATATDITTAPEVSVDATPVGVIEAPETLPEEAPAPEAPPFPLTFTPEAYHLAVTSATRLAPDGSTVPLFTDPGVIATLVSPAFTAIAAGLCAVRGVARTPDAIDEARTLFDAAAAELSAPTSAATINVGRYTGRKIMDGQNVMYAVASVVRVPDAALAVAWRAEWPGAKCNFAVRNDHVTTTRPAVNRGSHGWTNGHGGSVDVVSAWGGPFRSYNADGSGAR